MSTRTRTARIHTAEPLGGFVLRLGFDDGTVREVDLEAELWGTRFRTAAPRSTAFSAGARRRGAWNDRVAKRRRLGPRRAPRRRPTRVSRLTDDFRRVSAFTARRRRRRRYRRGGRAAAPLPGSSGSLC